MLDYQENITAPLEDIICRNFTAEIKRNKPNGVVTTTEVELIPQGSNIPVT
jgi:hypothetical protein